MNKFEFKFVAFALLAALIITQTFGCIHKETSKSDKEKIKDINKELESNFKEYRVTDDLGKKYSLEKQIRFQFKNKDLDFIENPDVKEFVKECIGND